MAISYGELYKSIVLEMSVLFPVEEARAIAVRLFEHYFHLSPSQRVMQASVPADADTLAQVKIAVNKILKHEPLQYVTGKAWFHDLEFEVNQSVLIPRPETEEMVNLILKMFEKEADSGSIKVLDIGTGSGCIAVTIGKYLKNSMVTAVDISDAALQVASHNARVNSVDITFVNLDILNVNDWSGLNMYDLIVSNPPYVTLSEKSQMLPNVIAYEPHNALFVPDDDPLLFYNAIMRFAKDRLNSGGTLWLEINEAFGPDVVSLFPNGIFSDSVLIKDMFGKSRFVKVTK